MKYYIAAVTLLKMLPLQHKIALFSTTVLMVAAIAWQPSKHTIHFPSFKKPAPISVPINITGYELSEPDSEPMGESLDQNDPQFQAPKDEIEQQLVQAQAEIESKHRVSSGETLGVIFSQYGLPISEMYRLIDANKSVQMLRVGQIQIGRASCRERV